MIRRLAAPFAVAALTAACAPALASSEAPAETAPAVAAPAGAVASGFASRRLSVFVDGPARPQGDVILIPGLTSSPAVWQGLTEALKDRYRVHRVHVAGFAGAPVDGNAEGALIAPVAEEIARYIAEQGLRDPAVIGHSMGGTMALTLAARHPDRVGRLMVVDMVPFVGALFGPPGTTVDSVRPLADQILAAQSGAPREQWAAQARASVEGMVRTEALRAGPVRDAETSDQSLAARSFHELVLTDLRPELPRIAAPTRVLYISLNTPGATPEISDAVYGALFADLAGASLSRVDDSGHFIMLDQPALFLREVEDFLR